MYECSNSLKVIKTRYFHYRNGFLSIHVLKEEKLPPQGKLNGILNDEECSDYSYLVAQKMWSDFNMTSFECYHNLYLK